MRYFKLFLMWLSTIVIMSYYGEYVLSREVNGFIQLLGLIGVIGVLTFVLKKTFDVLTKK